MESLTLSLDDCHGFSVDSCGNKALNLWSLMRHGLQVPRGFVITTNALESIFGSLDDAALNQSDPESAILAQASQYVMTVDITNSTLTRETADQLKALDVFSDDPLIVRSSSCSEDSGNASFAGVYSSIKTTANADQIMHAIREVYSSRYSLAALAYGRALKSRFNIVFPLFNKMAILIQRYVVSDFGGVLFTQDPLDNRYGRVEIASGGAHSIVSGITPQISAMFDINQGFVEEDDFVEVVNMCKSISTADSFVHQLSISASQIKTVFGSEQDIEWVWDGLRVWILQARPITRSYTVHG